MDAKFESSSTKKSASAANWSQLGDVLDLIVHKLDLVDFLHFSATCRSWHSSVQTHQKHCRVCPKTLNPWVLFTTPFYQKNEENKNHHLILYDIAIQKSYNIYIPDIAGTFCSILRSSNGFLVIDDTKWDLHVINPITGSRYPLPPSSSILDSPILYKYESGDGLFDKAFIKVCPYSHKPLFILGILSEILLFVKVGDISWTRLDNSHCDCEIDDAVFWKGKLYAVGKSGTYVFDLDHLLDRPTYLAAEYNTSGWNFLVESPNGDDLFLVVRDEGLQAEGWVTKGFVIFKFDEIRGRWYNVKDIGDLALLVGCGGNCLFFNPTSQFPNVVAKNNIFFSDEFNTGGVGVFDLNDGSIRRFNLPIYLPDLVPPEDWEAFWFTPLCN